MRGGGYHHAQPGLVTLHYGILGRYHLRHLLEGLRAISRASGACVTRWKVVNMLPVVFGSDLNPENP